MTFFIDVNFVSQAIIFAINVLVFLRFFYKYRYSSEYRYLYTMLGGNLCWSRGSASVLCLNCFLVLLPMCRNTLALIRAKVIGCVFRRVLDRNVWFHKACAIGIIVSTGTHIVAHVINAKRFSVNYSLKFRDLNFASYHNQEPLELVFTSVAGLTGLLMVIVLLSMIVTSTPAVRRVSYEIFWYTHHLFIVFFLLLFVHGFGRVIKRQVNLELHSPGCKLTKSNNISGNNSNVTWCFEDPVFKADEAEAWKWCIVPLFIYIMERLTRTFRSLQNVDLLQVFQHSDGVVEVKMSKRNFSAAAGQYVFIKCSDVSAFEWHPFTLTKCPVSDDPSFSIHCKTLGNWTEKFTDLLLQASAEEDKKSFNCGIENGKSFSNLTSQIKIAIDGPYGSPCMDIWSYDVSVCIATGIGVTPFAAIINELRTLTSAGGRHIKLKRLYFLWVCKHTESFQWFVDLLHSLHNELWESNRPDFLICNFYVTCSGSQLNDQIHKNLCNGWLLSRLHKNKPSWKAIFDRVSRENPRTKVGVFYCGSEKVTPMLKKTCRRLYPTGTRFIFNREILT
ncbi:unnamed protein product [Porites lobata]|uniref:FAD-binding FR-type domain-containing protein n=1 Tax=Porites lobata TaxID=104759 RepID=A0ABN8SDV1_9CNID|nr:unnamed protein product [Porites lobata]